MAAQILQSLCDSVGVYVGMCVDVSMIKENP